MGHSISSNICADWLDSFKVFVNGYYVYFDYAEHMWGPPTFYLHGQELYWEKVPKSWWNAFEKWSRGRSKCNDRAGINYGRQPATVDARIRAIKNKTNFNYVYLK